ncbi:hypothetical protein NQ315_000717 [Exocentrus adspersus]|uniref:Nicotinamide riboside kinase 1 n=1 Tax=Exocentrus adspersus TaxID=1586481 RepID=A0AAV8WDI3_9CUCU|nr:hypothetical protein NQ315_000717 [Exocentrus adspersus]
MFKYAKENPLLIVGISGVTCGGKTTTATDLKNILPNTTLFSQDDYFLDVDDTRHVWIPELNHINFDVISSLDMSKMYKDIQHFIAVNNFKQIKHGDTDTMAYQTNGTENGIHYTADISKSLCDQINDSKLSILIIEGFSIFNYEPMLHLFNLKYYFTLDQEECFKRRVKRVYEPPDCPGYFEKCVWPEYQQQLNEVKESVRDVKYLDGCDKNSVDKILKDISRCVLHKS